MNFTKGSVYLLDKIKLNQLYKGSLLKKQLSTKVVHDAAEEDKKCFQS